MSDPQNTEKPESDRDTVANTDTRRQSEWGEGTSQGGGITNRPIGEEIENENAVPERGQRDDDDDATLNTKI
jgi:hypothetical protein